MNHFQSIVVFRGGDSYAGGPGFGGAGLAVELLISLVIVFLGGFRAKNRLRRSA